MKDFLSLKNSENKNKSFFESNYKKIYEEKQLVRKKDERYEDKLNLNNFKKSREQR